MFAGLGYTTAMDAAIPALHARHAHEDLLDAVLAEENIPGTLLYLYGRECLGQYDDGEDVIYRLEVAATTAVSYS